MSVHSPRRDLRARLRRSPWLRYQFPLHPAASPAAWRCCPCCPSCVFSPSSSPSAHRRRPGSRKTGTLLIGIAQNSNYKLRNVTTALSTRLGTRLATGLDSSIARPVLAAASAGVVIILTTVHCLQCLHLEFA